MGLEMRDRLYSQIKIKAVDEQRREITGIATTPAVDSYGDIVEPDGAEYTLPIPLLWQHDRGQPIGEVFYAKRVKDGIEIKARLVSVDSPSQLSARLQEAWESIKTGLVKGLSIGFQALEYSILQETGGYRFTKWRWLELSAVTIAANEEASITAIRSMDEEYRAALGKKPISKPVEKNSGVSEKLTKTVKIEAKEMKMSLSEKLKGFREELKLKNEKLVELAEKSAKEGQTFDEADQETFDGLQDEVKSLEDHIKRLEVAEKAAMSTAKPVSKENGENEEGASKVRSIGTSVTVSSATDKVPGLAFARLAKSQAISQIKRMPAYEVAKQLYPNDARISRILEKAAVAPGTTTDSTWAAPLVGEESAVFADFAEFLRPETIVGKFGTGNIPALRNVPFRTRLIGQTTGGDAYWTGEGQAKGLTKFDFAGTSLDPLKVAAISVITKELAMDSSPNAEVLVRDGLRDALVARLDSDFINPSIAAIPGVRPASITNGVTPIDSVGTDAEAIRCDLRALLATFIAANNAPRTGVILMPTILALALSQMQNPLGQSEFPNLGMTGGIFLGFPTIVSDHIPEGYVFLVNASDIYYGDGEITVDMSDQASLQMDDAPDNPTTASTVMVSLWQRNLLGFLVEKRVNYAKRRPSAVAVLQGVNWGACAAS